MSEIARSQLTLVKFMIVLGAGVLVCLILVLCFGFAGVRFSSPSKSARDAKLRGIYLRHVALAPIEPVAKNGFSPKEAWLESIYENNMTIPFLRKKTAGIRLCVRFEYSPDSAIRSDMMLHDIEMTINGTSPKGQGGLRDATGFTFEFLPDPSAISPLSGGVFSEEGELTFWEKSKRIESEFRYSIK